MCHTMSSASLPSVRQLAPQPASAKPQLGGQQRVHATRGLQIWDVNARNSCLRKENVGLDQGIPALPLAP